MTGENSQEKPRMHGCLKGCLIFVGICMLTFIVTVGVIYHKRKAIKTWAITKVFETLDTGFLDALPEDVDKEQVRGTLDRLKKAVIEGKLSEEKLRVILAEFQEMMEDQELDADEVNHLLEIIDDTLTEKAARNEVLTAFRGN